MYLVDTLRADHLGCYGYERNTTPRIDLFASKSLLFEHCVAQSTWTKPASASVLTGLYPVEHGMLSEESVLPADVVPLAEILGKAGLRTGAFVTNQQVSRKKADLLRGFDTPKGMYSPDSDPPYMRAEEVVDASLEWIEDCGEEPFFCYVHTVDPHAPYKPPPPFDELFIDPSASDVDGSYVLHASGDEYDQLAAADVQRLIDLYDGEIAYTDQEFGRFLDGLDAIGRLRDTLVIFVADHGEAFAEHDSWGHNPFMYREVIRVPLLLRFPPGSGFPTGRRHDVCGQVDLAPTILDALDLGARPWLRGRSLLKDLEGGAAPPVFCEVEGGISRKAVVGSGHKYIRQWSPVARELLYDVERDPGETEDLADTDAIESMRAMLDGFLAATDSGYSLLVQSGRKDWMIADCRITADAPFDTVKLFYSDDKARHGERRDGPPEVAFESGTASLDIRFHVKAGDGDGILFVPGKGATKIAIEVWIEGEHARPEYIRLGATGRRPESVPFELSLVSGPDLAGPRLAARGALDGDPYRVSLWSNLSAATDEADLSEEDLEALRALGYAGEE